MKDILAGIGIATLFGIVLCLVLAFIGFLKIKIEDRKADYARKHRFDKPPTAACYCVDCRFHSTESLICHQLQEMRTADNWFCCHAEPRK